MTNDSSLSFQWFLKRRYGARDAALSSPSLYMVEESKAISTLIQINLKTTFLSRKQIKCSPSTLLFTNCFAVHTEMLLRRDCDRDNMAVGMLVFSKSSILPIYAVHTNTPSWHFQIYPLWREFLKKLRFQSLKVLVWTEGLSGGKSCVFKFLRLSVDVA